MLGLLSDFEDLFDFDYPVRGERLGDLLHRVIAGLEEQPLEDWGTAGSRGELVTDSGRYVSFHYRPHLFEGMDIKLRLAHKLQFHLLPRELPAEAPVSLAAVLESYCHLSGDLFGWEMLRDGKFLIWIVDMAGHGLRAGLASAILRVLITNLRERCNLQALLTELNRGLCGCVRSQPSAIYATSFFLVIAPDGSAAYSSAGHPPILVRRGSGEIECLGSIDRPLGLFDDSTYRSRELRLDPGDGLLLYTDGLVETTGHDGEPFGVDRLHRLFAAPFGDPASLTHRIYNEVRNRQNIDKLEDDITFVAARL